MTTNRSNLRQFWDKMTAPAPGGDAGAGLPAGAPAAAALSSAAVAGAAVGGVASEFVVIGLGSFGASLARTLIQYGFTVLAIDRDMARVQELSTLLPYVVQLDSTNGEALRQAGVDGFDVAVVCIGDDFESNLMTTVQLTRLGVKRVLAKARTSTQEEILLQLGAAEVILPEHEAGVRLGRRLASRHFVDFLELSDEVGIVELLAPRSLVGLTVAQADLRGRYGLSVLAVKRAETVHVSPAADFVLDQGDLLVVLGRIDAAEQVTD